MAAPELQAMDAAIVDAENFPELTVREEGVLCAAKYPEDGAWYRTQVIVDGSDGTEVFFMDYGNASMANELRSLSDELKVKPALSRKCALQKPRDIKSWSRKSEIKFNELAAEGATIFNVQFIASGDISIVELYLEGKSVTEELVGLCEEHPTTERPTPIGQDLHSSGKVCYVNNLEEFYIQLDDSMSTLDKVTEMLTGGEKFEQIGELKIGSICAAIWNEDGQWYRSRILEFCDVGYHVQFIDYGNKAKCEEFRQLPEDIAIIEPLAKCCRLAGCTDDPSNEAAKSKLEDLVAELVTFQIEFLDSVKEPSLVRLLLNGTDLSLLLTSDVIEDDKQDNVEPEQSNTKEEIPEVVAEEPPKEDLDSSQNELNESLDSTKTVIENKSFEENDSKDESIESLKNEITSTSEKTELSTDTLEGSNDTLKKPEKEDSKDSLNTDTGYISENDKSKDSPVKVSNEVEENKSVTAE